MSRPLLRRVTAVAAPAHVRVPGRRRPGTQWVVRAALPGAGCGRPLPPGAFAVRGLGRAEGRTHDPVGVAAGRPLHLPAQAAAALEPEIVLPPGTAVGADPRCPCCRDEQRKAEAERRRNGGGTPATGPPKPIPR